MEIIEQKVYSYTSTINEDIYAVAAGCCTTCSTCTCSCAVIAEAQVQ